MDQNDVEYWIKKLLSYYNVSTYTQLANKLNTTQQNITNWKTRSSVLAVEKKCRELGIYQDIFGDTNTQVIDTNNGINSINNSGKQTQKNTNNDLDFDNDVLTILKSALPIINDDIDKKENFKKHIKSWIIENL